MKPGLNASLRCSLVLSLVLQPIKRQPLKLSLELFRRTRCIAVRRTAVRRQCVGIAAQDSDFSREIIVVTS